MLPRLVSATQKVLRRPTRPGRLARGAPKARTCLPAPLQEIRCDRGPCPGSVRWVGMAVSLAGLPAGGKCLQVSASVCKCLRNFVLLSSVFLCSPRVLYLGARVSGCFACDFRALPDRSCARRHRDPRRSPAPSGRSKCSCNIRSKTAAGRHTRPAAPRHPVWEPRADPSWRPAGGRAQVGPGVGEAYRAGWNSCTGGRKNRNFAIPLTPITGGVDHHNAAPARLRYPKGAP